MGFGRRLALQVAAAVAVAIAAAAAITFLIVRGQLRDQVDDTLAERAGAAGLVAFRQASGTAFELPAPAGFVPAPLAQATEAVPAPKGARKGKKSRDAVRIGPGNAEIVPLPPGASIAPPATVQKFDPALALPPTALGGPDFLLQVVDESGATRAEGDGADAIPVGAEDLAVARGDLAERYTDGSIGGVPVRILTTPIAPGTALQIARPLTEVNGAVSDLLVVLALVTIGGAGAAALIGVAVGRRALRPIRQLTEAAEEVASTRDLARRIEGPGDGDEIDRLRISFNAMLVALERSVGAQRSLVADASHELRTPLTSLRANIEVLERTAGLGPDERGRILADVEAELVELGGLVDDVVELAREGSDHLERRDVRLDEVVGAAVERARRRAGSVRVEAELEPTLIEGDGERLDRAVANLLDNAVAWSPPSGTVHVELAGDVLTVRDQGPGIAAEDLPRVFDRFYRAPAARGRPGSGLGLAIVQRVADQHGATVEARGAEGGGTELVFRFPAGGSADLAGAGAPVEDLVVS